MKIIKELKRRNVIRVAVLYVVGGWLVLQFGDLLFDLMGLPDFALRIVLGILLLGFPVALVFSWVYEITPEGVRRDTGEGSIPSNAATSHKLNIAVLVTMTLAVLLLLGDRLLERGAPSPGTNPTPVVAEADPDTAPATAATDAAPQDPSVAVLPFLNLSADQEQEYFSDGLADTLLHRLAQVPELRVAARTSAFQFKDKNVDVREIAEQLGVASVLEGSVQRQGDRVRITAQLIRGADGIHIWSGVFDDTLDDIFRLQDEISHEVTEALTSTLLDVDEQAVSGTKAGETESIVAYEAYLKGRDALARGTTEGANEAVAQLELAVELDPEYALAWAYLVDAYGATARLGSVAWEATNAPKLAAAERAVALAPNLVESQLALAEALSNSAAALFANDRFAESDAAVERAFELGPNHAAAVRAMADVTDYRGNVRDALRLRERAVILDPLDSALRMDLAAARQAIGNVEGSHELARALVEAEPDNLDLRMEYAFLLTEGGQPLEGMQEFLMMSRDNPDHLRGLFLAMDVWLNVGDRDAALESLVQAEATAPDRAYDDRAKFCWMTNDLDCYRESIERYVALQLENGIAWRADLAAGMLALRNGDPNQTIARIERHVIDDGEFNPTDLAAAGVLANAYDLIGDTAQRDRVLDSLEAELGRRVTNGLWQFLTLDFQVTIAALRDDSGKAIDLLSNYMTQAYGPNAFQLENGFNYRKIRNDPRFPGLLERRKAQEAEWREALAEY